VVGFILNRLSSDLTLTSDPIFTIWAVIGPAARPRACSKGATKKGVHSVSEAKIQSEGTFSPE
jgi:hypothetical protein